MKVKSWEKKIILLPNWERRKEKSYASFKNLFFIFIFIFFCFCFCFFFLFLRFLNLRTAKKKKKIMNYVQLRLPFSSAG